MRNIYFTADLHLNHKNIIKYCNRPFDSVEEMNNTLINNWNKTVKNDDLIYIIGDLMFSNTTNSVLFLQKLKGEKILIKGNHDLWISPITEKYFTNIYDMLEIRLKSAKATLCHYPMISWRKSFHGSYMIHGHIHNSKQLDYWKILQDNPSIINAGVDINNFKPVTFEEMKENNKKWKNTL